MNIFLLFLPVKFSSLSIATDFCDIDDSTYINESVSHSSRAEYCNTEHTCYRKVKSLTLFAEDEIVRA